MTKITPRRKRGGEKRYWGKLSKRYRTIRYYAHWLQAYLVLPSSVIVCFTSISSAPQTSHLPCIEHLPTSKYIMIISLLLVG
jgi:hypothetical protein